MIAKHFRGLVSLAAGLLFMASSVRAGVKCIGADAATGTSAAVIVDDVPLVHTAQILPLDTTGQLAGKGDAASQARQILENLDTVLKVSASDLDKVVKLNVCLANAEALAKVQQVLASTFHGAEKPAVSFVTGGIAHEQALVAMDAVAVAAPEGVDEKWPRMPDIYATPGMRTAALLPSGPKIYISGMADTNGLPEATRKTLEKLIVTLFQMGLRKTDIVQLKAFLEPVSEVAVVRKEIIDFFRGAAPPIVFVEWISPKPNPPIEIELIAGAHGDFTKETESVSFLTPPGTTSTKVFSRVARVNHGKLIFISGLYGTKSQDGGGQVREMFDSLKQILKPAGSDFEHLVKATYYVSENDASDTLNQIRTEFYNPQRPPAASKAKVKNMAVPGKTVMMDMIAVSR
jgi:enamine deaminase RidA (YjgF/YER057c/UK114 family)